MYVDVLILHLKRLVINSTGLLNTLWGVILPAVATPTGVFLLRQYMLTIPDELIEAARMDHASEWRIYWRIVLPLSARTAAGRLSCSCPQMTRSRKAGSSASADVLPALDRSARLSRFWWIMKSEK